jgi:hypothetical protein
MEAKADYARGDKLPEREGLLEALQMKEEDFSREKPLSAEELLSTDFGRNTYSADAFTKATSDYLNDSAYSTVENAGDGLDIDFAYSMTVEDKFYGEDGELKGRTEHKQEQNYNHRGLTGFRKGRGLTEDQNPDFIKSAKHTSEEFDGITTTSHAEVENKEHINEDEDEIGKVETTSRMVTGTGANRITTVSELQDELKQIDEKNLKAAMLMGESISGIFEDYLNVFKRDQENEEPIVAKPNW